MNALQLPIREAAENIALSDPLSAVLALLGAVFIGFSMLVFGGLTAGAVLDFVTPE